MHRDRIRWGLVNNFGRDLDFASEVMTGLPKLLSQLDAAATFLDAQTAENASRLRTLMNEHGGGARIYTEREEAMRRVAEIDAMFDDATGWGSWMVMAANEREALADRYGFEHKHRVRCGGRRTD